jgi:hypothetical protein
MAAVEGVVFGHYISKDGALQPVLQESSELFAAIVGDSIAKVEEEFEPGPYSRLNQLMPVLYWGSNTEPKADTTPNEASASTSVAVKSRTLVMLASFHGSLRVLSYLLSKGADPTIKSPDGLTAYDVSAAPPPRAAAAAPAPDGPA